MNTNSIAMWVILQNNAGWDCFKTPILQAQFNRIRGLRLDGIPALDLWDLIVSVLGNTIQTHDRTGQPVVNCDKNHGPGQQSRGILNVWNNVDCSLKRPIFASRSFVVCV